MKTEFLMGNWINKKPVFCVSNFHNPDETVSVSRRNKNLPPIIINMRFVPNVCILFVLIKYKYSLEISFDCYVSMAACKVDMFKKFLRYSENLLNGIHWHF